MTPPSAALATIGPHTMALPDSRAAVAPRNLEDVSRMAKAIAKSGLYGVQSEDEAMIRMATGMELGFSMLQSIRGVYVMTMGGKKQPGLYADMMVGACKAHPEVCEYFRLVETSATRATYATKRAGEPEEVKMSFTIEQARNAGLASKDTWKSYPEAMLRARASTALARTVYPDLLNGLYSVEEMRDAGPTVVAHTPDGEVVEAKPLEGQLEESVEIAAEQKKLYESLMVGMLDARSMDALETAAAAIHEAVNAKKITMHHRGELIRAYREVKKGLTDAINS